MEKHSRVDVSEYQLKSGSRILHIGCEKGFWLSDLLDLNSQFDLYGPKACLRNKQFYGAGQR